MSVHEHPTAAQAGGECEKPRAQHRHRRGERRVDVHDVLPTGMPPHQHRVRQGAAHVAEGGLAALGRAVVGNVQEGELVRPGEVAGAQVGDEGGDPATIRGTLRHQQDAAPRGRVGGHAAVRDRASPT
jgi:hypothetical protein